MPSREVGIPTIDEQLEADTDEDWRVRFPRRTVHLDFHIGPDIPNVASDFDADSFARTFADAHVDSVTVFAKCHHGLLYYDTDRPERHPSLSRGLDLLGEQIEALHGARIRAPIYLSVQCDEYAAHEHPDWVALSPELTQVRRPPAGAYEAAWTVLDMSSPYQEYLAEQLAEVLDRYAPVDGIFLDMCWDQPSASRWAIAGMKKAQLDPSDPGQRDIYARRVALQYMARFSAMIEPALVRGSATGAWFNSRPKANLVVERDYLRHIEVEALPGGQWGYSYLPYVAPLVRNLGLPALSQTGRFHRSWGDSASLKTPAALKYECCRILMYGLSNGVGDLLAPSGVPNRAVYSRIGEVYEYIKACEPYVERGRHLVDIALVADPAQGDRPADGVSGALRALQRLRQQFDVVPPDAPLEAYKLAVVPDGTPVDTQLAGRLERYVAGGGALLLSASVASSGEEATALFTRLGFELEGLWPFDPVFLALTEAGLLDPPPGIDVRVPGRSTKLRTPNDGKVLVDLVLPYFQRAYDHFSGHSYTSPSQPSGYGAVVQRGRVVVLAVPLFAAVATEDNLEYLQVLGACFEHLLPRPLLRAKGPVHLETAVVDAAYHTSVHLLSFVPARLARDLDLVFDPFPLVDVEVSLRSLAAPRRVVLQPAGDVLACEFDGQYASVSVSVPDGHAIIVFER
ncbi:MAG: alpha-amylase family protein [Acidimicrobiales bacterium]